MLPRAPFGIALLALMSCRSTPAPTPAAPTPRVEVSAADAATPDGMSAATDAAAASDAAASDAVEDAPYVPATPQEAFLRALADGSAAVASAVDPLRGVARITYAEGPAGGDDSHPPPPNRIASSHLCGAALSPLRDDLRRATEQGALLGIRCDAAQCVVSGMEYAPTWIIRFAPAGDSGTPRIASITEVSEAAMGEAWTRRAEAYVRAHLAAETARRCPAR